jgi:hypothetical protein
LSFLSSSLPTGHIQRSQPLSIALYTLHDPRSTGKNGTIVSLKITQAPFFSHGQETDSDDKSISDVALHYERIRAQKAYSTISKLTHPIPQLNGFLSPYITSILLQYDDDQLIGDEAANPPHTTEYHSRLQGSFQCKPFESINQSMLTSL